jgi:hypothetical protein
VKTGNILVKRVSELGQADLARKIARYLVNSESLSPESITVLADLPAGKPADRQPANDEKAGEED